MKTNIKKIILIGTLILSNIIFAQEIYLKDNLFYSKNNKEILYSGKDSFKNKNFYGAKIIFSKKVKEYGRNNTITKEITEENGVKKVSIYDDYGKVIK